MEIKSLLVVSPSKIIHLGSQYLCIFGAYVSLWGKVFPDNYIDLL